MKLVVFAHTPPPHHGQSYMVQMMLTGFVADHQKQNSVQCYHVNCRLSDDIASVGNYRPRKIFKLLLYCIKAVWFRFRYKVETLYYVPAPAKKSAIFRDWIVMMLVRPWFKKTIFHWHALGLGHWTEQKIEYPMKHNSFDLKPPQIFGKLDFLARIFTARLMAEADLSIVLTQYNRNDAELLKPKKTCVICNGIPDPCPEFETTILHERQQRLQQRKQALYINPIKTPEVVYFRCLFLAHCTELKGLFDALEAVATANKRLADKKLTMRISLSVAGEFISIQERKRFDKVALAINKQHLAVRDQKLVKYYGFVSGIEKDALLRKNDCLIFPTRYPNEAQPVTMIEAMAYGMPVVASNWRGIGETLPHEAATSLDFSSSLLDTALLEVFSQLRYSYKENHSVDSHIKLLQKAIHALN
ncbi:MAG: glycosyltransferase [Verrucomicrobiota bacterium]